MDERLERIEQQIKELQERNVKVDTAKAWERSISRITFIVILTYILATILLGLIGNPNPFLNALIPTAGYYLSMQSLPFVKQKWIEYRMKKQSQKSSSY